MTAKQAERPSRGQLSPNNSAHLPIRSRLSKAIGFRNLQVAGPQTYLARVDLTGLMMDAIRAFPPLRNRRSDAFRMLSRSARSEPGSVTPDAVPEPGSISGSLEQASSRVKLHVRGISKTYGNTTVLKPFELKVQSGELLAVLGPSGSGKTTLLQIICGLVEPSGGRLIVDGRDETENPADKRDIGVVFQNYALFPHLTVRENVAFPLQMRKVAAGELWNRVE